MRSFIFVAFMLVGSSSAPAGAADFDGKLPMYPSGHNMNNMPAGAVAQGVPLVMETDDAVSTVDAWYQANASNCVRTTAQQAVKYQCDGGSIMIYAKGKTQIALIPAFALHP